MKMLTGHRQDFKCLAKERAELLQLVPPGAAERMRNPERRREVLDKIPWDVNDFVKADLFFKDKTDAVFFAYATNDRVRRRLDKITDAFFEHLEKSQFVRFQENQVAEVRPSQEFSIKRPVEQEEEEKRPLTHTEH